jgi:transposase
MLFSHNIQFTQKNLLCPAILYIWYKQSQSGKEQTQVGTLDGESSLQREVRRMRQEIDYLRRQRDILKKALGIVSADVPGSALR